MSEMANHPNHERLQAFVEDSLDGGTAASVESHLATCARCSGEVDELRTVFTLLSSLEYEAPAADFADRVMTRVRIPRPWFAGAREWAEEWAERLTPKSTRALALTSFMVALPALATTALVYWVLSRPGVSMQGLWVISSNFAARAMSSAGDWMWSHIAGSSLATWAVNAADLVASLGRGGVSLAVVMFATFTAASVWILYQNLFRTEARGNDYASYVF